MIGIIPAAGKGGRIEGKCKSLIMINGKYIIETILENMRKVGIEEIYVIQNGNEIEKTIGYDYYGVEINYIQQENQTGLNDAIRLCKDLTSPMLVILGDIIYEGDDLKKMVEDFKDGPNGVLALVAYKKENDFREIQKSFGFTEKWPMKTIEKPKPEDANNLREYLGLGIFIITHKLIDLIGEEPFTETFNQAQTTTTIQELKGRYFNINTEEDLANANNNPI